MTIFRDEILANDWKFAAFNDYEFAESVTIRRRISKEAKAIGQLTGTTVTSIVITDGGTGYLSQPTYIYSGVGTSLLLENIVIISGQIISADVQSSSTDHTVAPIIQFQGGYEDWPLNACIRRPGIESVVGRKNISDYIRISVSRQDMATIDTGRDKVLLYKRTDDTALSELSIINVIAGNEGFWILEVK